MKSGFHIGSHTNHSLGKRGRHRHNNLKKIVGFFAENIVLTTFFYLYGITAKKNSKTQKISIEPLWRRGYEFVLPHKTHTDHSLGKRGYTGVRILFRGRSSIPFYIWGAGEGGGTPPNSTVGTGSTPRETPC